MTTLNLSARDTNDLDAAISCYLSECNHDPVAERRIVELQRRIEKAAEVEETFPTLAAGRLPQALPTHA